MKFKLQYVSKVFACGIIIPLVISCSTQSNTSTLTEKNTTYNVSFSGKPQFDPLCKQKNAKSNMLDLINKCMDSDWLKALSTNMPDQEIRERLSDSTFVSFNKQHGTQVAYLSSSGNVFLWYPGNTQILKGKWALARKVGNRSLGVINVCFNYPANSINPVTGRPGGSWLCGNAKEYLFVGDTKNIAGDNFTLQSSDTVPFIMEKQRKYNASDLMLGT